jgi:hypothetical protein
MNISTRLVHWTPQKNVGNKFPSKKLLLLDTKHTPPLPPMLTRQSCRNFKSLPFCKQKRFHRDFFTKRLRKKSATSNPARNFYHWTPNPSAVTPYVIKRKMPEFQIASVLQTMDTLTRFIHWTNQKKVGNKFPSKKLLPLDTKPPPTLPPMLTRERWWIFKSLPFFSQVTNPRKFCTERLRKRSAKWSPARNSYHWTRNPSAATP